MKDEKSLQLVYINYSKDEFYKKNSKLSPG